MYILYYNFYNISNYFLLMEYEVGVEPTRNGVAVRSPTVSISYNNQSTSAVTNMQLHSSYACWSKYIRSPFHLVLALLVT